MALLRTTLPPARHQRRILVAGQELLADAGRNALLDRCRHWQHNYLGGLFVSLPETFSDDGCVETVARLLRRGLSAQTVTFFAARSRPPLATLHHRLGRRLPDAAAEVLAVGATDVLGYPATVVTAAAMAATAVNTRLGAAEFAVPRPLTVTASGQTTPPAAVTLPQPVPQVAAALLAEGARKIRREAEQRLDILEELGQPCAP